MGLLYYVNTQMLINRLVPFGAGAGGLIAKISDTGFGKPFSLFLKRGKPIKRFVSP